MDSTQKKPPQRSIPRSAFDPNGGICEGCEKYRSLRDGLCHECETIMLEQAIETDEDGKEWTPGGYAL